MTRGLVVPTLVCVALLAAAAGTAMATLPASTAGAVTALAAREVAVLAQLKAFPKAGSQASVSDWEAGLKAAEAAQTKAEAALEADITTTPKASTTQTTPKASTTPSNPGVGAILSFKDENGDAYSVQLVQVIDPAQGADQFTTPNTGDRFVAAVFKITDTGSASISDDANDNASIVGSDDESYSADFDSVAECTNFNSGTYQVAPGESLTGCVVFQIPTSVNISKVEWSPTSGFGGSFGQWTVA